MSMPLDLYVIRHGESEANVIVQAGEQGDNSLYTQDNVTVPDRSWRLTATGRKQADCIGRWLVSQQQLFDRYMVSPYVRTRETAATMALPKAKWEENRVLRERSWGEINTITTQAGRLHRPLAGQPAAAVRPLHGLAIRAHPRNRSHHGPAQGQMGGEPCAA